MAQGAESIDQHLHSRMQLLNQHKKVAGGMQKYVYGRATGDHRNSVPIKVVSIKISAVFP